MFGNQTFPRCIVPEGGDILLCIQREPVQAVEGRYRGGRCGLGRGEHR